MPPSTPTLTLARASGTSFTASVTGDASATHTLYYGTSGSAPTTAWGVTVAGSGDFGTVTGLSPNGSYAAYAVASEAGSYSLPGFAWVSLAAAGTLAGAVHAWFNGDAALVAAIPGGLWTGEVPEGTSFPYAWLELPEATSLPNFVDQLEASRVVFHVWAVGAEAAQLAAEKVRARFDYRQLDAYGDSACVGMVPRHWRLQCEGLRDPAGRLVFRAVVGYQVLTQRPRASAPGRV
jgi:hypothetical protein